MPLRGFRIPDNRINQIFRDIINFVLRNIRDGGTEEETSSGWSSWEDLGGTLTSAPGVASWGENRLDVLARTSLSGTNGGMAADGVNGKTLVVF